MVFQRISKGDIIPIRFKHGFLTLGKEINGGIRNNTWFGGVFMNKGKWENGGKRKRDAAVLDLGFSWNIEG